MIYKVYAHCSNLKKGRNISQECDESCAYEYKVVDQTYIANVRLVVF